MTSGIPDPAAAGAMKAQRAPAAVANPKFKPAYATKALKYLRWNQYHVVVIFGTDTKGYLPIEELVSQNIYDTHY